MLFESLKPLAAECSAPDGDDASKAVWSCSGPISRSSIAPPASGDVYSRQIARTKDQVAQVSCKCTLNLPTARAERVGRLYLSAQIHI
jgi:hypothetical protein